MLRASRIVG